MELDLAPFRGGEAHDGREGDAIDIAAGLAAFSTNTVTKMVFAFTAGGPSFALYVIPGQLLMLAAAWAAMLVA